MYPIEKGIEMPSTNGKTKYPFATMEIGDSFFVEGKEKKNKVMSAVSQNSRRHAPKKFTTRFTDDGIRVWRTQ